MNERASTLNEDIRISKIEMSSNSKSSDMMLVLIAVLAIASATVSRSPAAGGGTRYKLPDVHYPRETDPTKMTPLDKYVTTYDDTAGYTVYDHGSFPTELLFFAQTDLSSGTP